MMKKLLLLLCLATLLITGHATASDIVVPKGILVLNGEPAKPFTLSDIDGVKYSLKQKPGQWTFVHFWASWCGPCRREMPTIQKLSQIMKDTTLQIFMINTAENEDTIFNFMGIVAPDMNSLMDRNGTVTEQWQPRGLPTTFLIDPQGRKRYMAIGGRKWDTKPYVDFLQALLKQKT
jgi:thiol-disulfide isomerase/thioredoxin